MKKSLTISPKMSPQATIRQKKGALAHFQGRHSLSLEKNVSFTFNVTHSNTNYQDNVHCGARTLDTQWRHKSKKSENLGWYGRQNMLRPYLKIWKWELIFGHAVSTLVFLLCNENLDSFLTRVRKLFKGGNYMRKFC